MLRRVAPWVVFAVAAVAFLVVPPLHRAPGWVDSERPIVGAMTAGSSEWIRGVRPGMTVERWPGTTDADHSGGFDALGGELRVGVPPRVPPPPMTDLAAGILAALAALVLSAAGLPGSAVLLAAGSGMIVTPLLPLVATVVAVALGMLPAGTAFVASVTDGTVRRVDAGVWIAACAGLTALVVVASASPEREWRWDLIWYIPGVLGVMLAIRSGLRGLRSRRRSTPSRSSWLDRLLVPSFPLARRSALIAGADERARIATELHGDVLPSLSLAIAELNAGVDQHVAAVHLRHAADTLRRLVGDRDKTVIEAAGLAVAVESFSRSLDGLTRVHVSHASGPQRPPPLVEIAAYRIAQLAITNAVLHAAASAIEVHLLVEAHRVELSVEDDGIGIPDDGEGRAVRTGHFGIGEMRATATAISAHLAISSGRPTGTTVRVLWTR